MCGNVSAGCVHCIDGTPAQDICTTGPGTSDLGDVCPGGATDVDTCDENSPDLCVGGKPENDECKPPGDKDECPTGEPPEDECTAAGGCSGGDQEGTNPVVDNCMPPEDACIIPDPDIPNPE